jgi:hypothetical protein
MKFGDMPTSEDGAESFLAAWRKAHAERRYLKTTFDALSPIERQELNNELYESLYRNLDTLDSKAAGLIGGCAILFVVDAFLAQYFITAHQTIPPFIIISGLLALVAFGTCSMVVRVRWPSASKLQKDSFQDVLIQFIILRNSRTRVYIVAWWTMIGSTVSVLFHFLAYVATSQISLGGVAG